MEALVLPSDLSGRQLFHLVSLLIGIVIGVIIKGAVEH